MPLAIGLNQHIETYAMEMASIIGSDPEMRHVPSAMIELVCRKLAYATSHKSRYSKNQSHASPLKWSHQHLQASSAGVLVTTPTAICTPENLL